MNKISQESDNHNNNLKIMKQTETTPKPACKAKREKKVDPTVEFHRGRLPELYECADRVFDYVSKYDVKFPPGTYTAKQIHQLFLKVFYKNVRDDMETYQYCIREVNEENLSDPRLYSPSQNYRHYFTHKKATVGIPTALIFKHIDATEKFAKIKRKEKRVWTKSEDSPLIATATAVFDSQDVMKGLGNLIKPCASEGYKNCPIFSLHDGSIHSLILCTHSLPYFYEKGDKHMPNLVFALKCSDLGQIYGECRIDLHQRDNGQYVLSITNPDGWVTITHTTLSSTDIYDDIYKAYQFEYHNIHSMICEYDYRLVKKYAATIAEVFGTTPYVPNCVEEKSTSPVDSEESSDTCHNEHCDLCASLPEEPEPDINKEISHDNDCARKAAQPGDSHTEEKSVPYYNEVSADHDDDDGNHVKVHLKKSKAISLNMRSDSLIHNNEAAPQFERVGSEYACDIGCAAVQEIVLDSDEGEENLKIEP